MNDFTFAEQLLYVDMALSDIGLPDCVRGDYPYVLYHRKVSDENVWRARELVAHKPACFACVQASLVLHSEGASMTADSLMDSCWAHLPFTRDCGRTDLVSAAWAEG